MDEPTTVSSPRSHLLDRSTQLHVLNRELNPSRGFVKTVENLYELERWKNLCKESVYNSSFSLGYIVAADIDQDQNEYLLYCSENRFIRMCKVEHLRDKKTMYMNFEVRSAAYVQLGPSLETYLVGTNDGSIKLFSVEDSIMLEDVKVEKSKIFNSIQWNTRDKRKPYLAYAVRGKHQADVFDFVSGMKNLSIATNGGECTAVSWNPCDSHIITLGTAGGKVEHYDVRKTKSVLRRSNVGPDPVITVHYTEDGLYLVVLYADRRVIVFDAISLEQLVVAYLPPRMHVFPLCNVSLHVRVQSCGHHIFMGIPCRELSYYVEIDMISKSFDVKVLRSPFGGMTCCAFVTRKQHLLTFGRAQLTWQATMEGEKGVVRTIHVDDWDEMGA